MVTEIKIENLNIKECLCTPYFVFYIKKKRGFFYHAPPICMLLYIYRFIGIYCMDVYVQYCTSYADR